MILGWVAVSCERGTPVQSLLADTASWGYIYVGRVGSNPLSPIAYEGVPTGCVGSNQPLIMPPPLATNV